ncbi:MAG: hypothetical protein JJT88_17370 [Gammaproteobacteria bacterium]|nr:hypothetical protein [Gammaproteobacteria bacterium]
MTRPLFGLAVMILVAGGATAAGADAVTVDGTTYPMDRVLLCEPYEEYGSRQELELQGLHQGDGGRAQVDIAITVMGTLVIQEVSWSGPEGLFNRQGTPDETLFEVADDRVRGALEIADAYGRSASVRISFDIGLPEDYFACR